MIEFQPDDATTPEEKNEALASLVTLAGVWHDRSIASLRRVDQEGAHGWEATFA